MAGSGVTEMGSQDLVETQYQLREKKIDVSMTLDSANPTALPSRMVKMAPFTLWTLSTIQDGPPVRLRMRNGPHRLDV